MYVERGAIMHIKTLLQPVEDLHVIYVDDTVGKALNIIEKEGFLSLPVVEGDKFIGILSRRYIYETYFKEHGGDKEAFLNRKVKDFMKTKIPTIHENILIEEAAGLFLDKKLRFIPVVNDKEQFIGIITTKSMFKKIKSIFGINEPRLVIYTYDFKGKLARILDIIAKAGGNIKNIVQLDTEVMGLQEISLRIQSPDIKKIIEQLELQGFDVREYK